MADIAKIKDELISDPLTRGYATMTDQEVAYSLNAKNIVVNVAVPVSELKRFFFVEGIWTSIKNATDTPASVIRDALVMFDSIRMNDPEVRAKVEQIIVGLVQAGHMTAAQQTALLSMGETLTSRAEQLNLLGASFEIGPAHVAQARAL